MVRRSPLTPPGSRWKVGPRTRPAPFLDPRADLCSSGPAGVPHFTQEPQDVSVLPDVPFNLTCAAVGPPGPVEVLWWLGGVRVGEARPSPFVLPVAGQLPRCILGKAF